MIKEDKILAGFCIIILILSMVLFAAVKEDEKDETGEEEKSESEIILETTQNYSTSGTMITSEALYNNLNDNFASNDPFILSVRGKEDYAKGHIPGAINIPWRRVFTEENLTKLPKNQQIVVYCYTGHTASQITALLNVNGYDAVCLKWGICSWTTNSTIASSCYDKIKDAHDYQVATGTKPGEWKSGTRCGEDDTSTETTTEETFETDDKAEGILLKATSDYLASGKPPAITASALYENLNDGKEENNPLIISIRSAEQYAKGHIPGSVNIGFSSLFTDENITWLDENTKDDRQIVVICYTGHTASQATALLNINGYNATALKWAMTSWSSDPEIAPSAYNKLTDGHNYPIFIGEEAGDLENAIIADTYEVVNTATNDFLNSGKSTLITAEALYNNLNDKYDKNDPYILSIRKEEDYAKGHIPGAINIPYSSVFTEENILKLPTNQQIVVYCYTGHTASQVTAMLNVMGYDALCLKWGMCSWTTNTTIAYSCYDKSKDSHDYPVIIGSNPTKTRSGTRQCGDGNGGSGEGPEKLTGSVFDIIRGVCNNYLSEGKNPVITAEDLYDNLKDGDESNDPFILSIRKPDQYAIGHIAGAINKGFSSLFTEENLSNLPKDKQIVVVCYTGHTASQATALLNINGYDAIALKWGMTSWSKNTTVAPSGYNRGKDCKNYPVFIGTEPGDMISAEIVGLTDSEIILDATRSYLEAGTKFIDATVLYGLLDDTNETNDPFIISIRKPDDYKLGHIPTSINIPWRSLFSVDNLFLLPDDDTQVVVVCYTGQTASQITALLNVLGYNASTLKHGMCSWNYNASNCFNNSNPTHQFDYPVSEGSDQGSIDTAKTRGCGDNGGGSGGIYEASSDEWEILRQACERYVNDTVSMTITAKALLNNLNDSYTANDPHIISLRKEEHYILGHVPGAENIGTGSILNEDYLEVLPQDKQIVVYCYTGQDAGHVSAMLNINGYDAISLKFGMCSWTDNTTITAGKCYNPDTAGHDYKVYEGLEAGEW